MRRGIMLAIYPQRGKFARLLSDIFDQLNEPERSFPFFPQFPTNNLQRQQVTLWLFVRPHLRIQPRHIRFWPGPLSRTSSRPWILLTAGYKAGYYRPFSSIMLLSMNFLNKFPFKSESPLMLLCHIPSSCKILICLKRAVIPAGRPCSIFVQECQY